MDPRGRALEQRPAERGGAGAGGELCAIRVTAVRDRQRRRHDPHRRCRHAGRDERLVDQRRHRDRAGVQQMHAVALEPIGMVARVRVPVDHADPAAVLRGGGRDVVVHRHVGMARRAQGHPPHVLDAARLHGRRARRRCCPRTDPRNRCSRCPSRRSGRASSRATGSPGARSAASSPGTGSRPPRAGGTGRPGS